MPKASIALSEHFTYKKLLRFTLPSVAMMLFTSIYYIVDGYFVSNFVGATPFAAVNLIMPFIMIFDAVGFMVGSGGTALVAKTLGEGKRKKANELFSLLIYLLIATGAVFSVISIMFMDRMARLLGADAQMLPHCTVYGKYVMAGLIPFALQSAFQSFCVTAERPKMGFFITLAAGITNMVLDALFMGVFGWGVEGAGLATMLSQCVGGFVPLIYFAAPNKSLLRLGKTHWDPRAVLKSCTNGASEFVTNISFPLVNMLYNYQLMKLAGEKGVAAFGVLMYTAFMFVAVFIGYSIGSAPLFGYNFGAKNHEQLHNLFKKSMVIVGAASVVLTALAVGGANPICRLYVGYDKELLALSQRAYRIFSISLLCCGFNIFGSAFFTALNNGKVSAAISFSRTLVFQLIAIFTLPLLWGVDGVWFANDVAELAALAVTVTFFLTQRKKYKY
ncbi:MAG: MATE family efflux transporter [Clostridia bacterium]|nr:MATE family efflux transporter [Clostridia bacterium]